MEFFEKLGKKASETYKTAAEKTNKIANDTKLKMKINDNKSKINDKYTEIGKKVYQKYVLDGNLDIKDDINEELDKIKKLTDEIEEFEMQRLALSDMKQCINCKNTIEKSAKFCPECGTEQPIEEIEIEVVLEEDSNEECSKEEKECSECGVQNEEYSKEEKECSECGVPNEEDSKEENTENESLSEERTDTNNSSESSSNNENTENY